MVCGELHLVLLQWFSVCLSVQCIIKCTSVFASRKERYCLFETVIHTCLKYKTQREAHIEQAFIFTFCVIFLDFNNKSEITIMILPA